MKAREKRPRQKPGPKAKYVNRVAFTSYLSLADYERLCKAAYRLEVSRAQLIGDVLLAWLDDYEQGKSKGDAGSI